MVKRFSTFDRACVTRPWTYKYRVTGAPKVNEVRGKRETRGTEGNRAPCTVVVDSLAFCSYLARTNFHEARIHHGATNNYRCYTGDIQIAFLTPRGRQLRRALSRVLSVFFVKSAILYAVFMSPSVYVGSPLRRCFVRTSLVQPFELFRERERTRRCSITVSISVNGSLLIAGPSLGEISNAFR